MYKARIRIDGLACLVFRSDEAGFDKTAVVLPGIPYVTDQEAITPVLAAMGYGVIQPQYVGTFDSDGKFTPESAIDTLFKVQSLLERNAELFDLRSETRFKVGKRIDVLAAHSFGTYAAMGAILRGFGVPVSLMFSPMFEFGAKCNEAGLRVDLEKHVRHMSEALPLTLRMKSPKIWREFFVRENTFHPPPRKSKCQQPTQLLCIVGDKDPSIDSDTSKQYVRQLADDYHNCLHLVDFMIVAGASHDVKTMLTPTVQEVIRRLVQ